MIVKAAKQSKQNKHFHVKVENARIKMLYEYCGGPINSKPKVLEFANFQRFFSAASAAITIIVKSMSVVYTVNSGAV
jgi:hypothetical protein